MVETFPDRSRVTTVFTISSYNLDSCKSLGFAVANCEASSFREMVVHLMNTAFCAMLVVTITMHHQAP